MASGVGVSEELQASRGPSGQPGLASALRSVLRNPTSEQLGRRVDTVEEGEDDSEVDSLYDTGGPDAVAQGGGGADGGSAGAANVSGIGVVAAATLHDAATLQLISAAPEELAAEFEERLALIELELEEEKEKARTVSREWQQRYTELEIKAEVQENQLRLLREELQEEQARRVEEKRKLKNLYVERDLIKIVETEVQEVMELRDREMSHYRDIKEAEIQQIRSRHLAELNQLGERLRRLLEDAQRTHEIKSDLLDAIGTSKGVIHQDPLKILEFLSDVHIRLADAGGPPGLARSAVASPAGTSQLSFLAGGSFLTAGQKTMHSTAVGMSFSGRGHLAPSRAARRDYEGTLALMQDVLRLERDQHAAQQRAEAGEGEQPPEQEEDLTALEEAVALAQLEREDATAQLQRLETYLEELSALAKEQPTSLQAMEDAHEMAAEAVARFERAEKTEREATEKKLAAEKRQVDARLGRLMRDPLLSKVTADCDFADALEAVLRDNERMRARLQALADTPNASLSQKELEEKRDQLRDNVDDLTREAERLNLACERLEEQRKAYKRRAREAAQEASRAEASSPTQGSPRGAVRSPESGPTVAQIWGGDTDSENVSSAEEEPESEEDDFDPTEELARDQVAGVEELVEEPEEFEPEQFELEKKQFLAAMRKEAHVASLIEQILQYLECGTVIYRLDKGNLSKDFAFLAHNRSMVQVCMIHEGKPERKRGIRMVSLREVREILMGQSSDRFRMMLKRTEANVPVDPSDLAKVDKDSEKIEAFNTGQYFYRSISLKLKRDVFDFVCNNDSDFECWTVALHRITTLVPHYGRPLDLVGNAYRGLDELNEEERDWCALNHVPPLLYLNAKMQCLKQQNKCYLTLYDVRTLSGFDLIHSQKLFELWMLSGWIEKQFVYQIRYLDIYPEEASNLLQIVDAERQRQRRAEQQRLLYGDQH
eukprot:TRINITY_DN66607_c0_g1_i1.p1 TRINITY_DN66607_c0_g1~~TRINITY_DN66607_c0_g1_i1.p1  ORF type:complete len:946 (+),score=425.66 TRINITY_DN66607_c0_g1_i1:77-2914(+)